MNENVCCACGAQIPEGVQICKPCDELLKEHPEDAEERRTTPEVV